MDNKQKLISLVGQSPLSEEDKKVWVGYIENYPLEAIESFLEIFSGFPDEITWFNDLYKRKRAAFELLRQDKDRAQGLLRDIFLAEKNKLAELLSR